MQQQPTYVGLDMHKSTIVADALDLQGRRIDQAKLSSSDAELRAYLRAIPGDQRVVMAAFTFREHSFDVTTAEALSVVLSHPYKTRIIAEARVKTDRFFGP